MTKKKSKIDASKLLPKKVAIAKNPPSLSPEKIEQAVNKIHDNGKQPAAETPADSKEELVRFTLDIPKSMHREMKGHVLDIDKSLKEYILALVAEDLKKNKK